MRRVGPHSFTEVYFAGCNPSFVETSDGYVMIDSPQQPIDAVRCFPWNTTPQLAPPGPSHRD